MMNKIIQDKWKEGYIPGHDCITYGDGKITVASTICLYDSETKESSQYWSPMCDSTVESFLKYDDDIWTPFDIYHGAFVHANQKIVFGDGAMGNEGYVASTNPESGELNWSIFFTFSNPIMKAEIKDDLLICYGDTGTVIEIMWNDITKIKVTTRV